LAEKLKATAKKQGKSGNQLTIEFIKASLGLDKEKKFSCEYDDLDDLFVLCSEEEFKAIYFDPSFFPSCKWPFSWLS
jgi:hypothetical protein